MSAHGSAIRAIGAWLPALVMAGVIFLLSAQSDTRLSPNPATDWLLRKTAHLIAYGMLAFLALFALHVARAPRRTALALLIASAYAASDELHQSFVPGRSPEVRDVLIDVCGAAVGVIAWHALARVRQRRASGRGS